MQEIDNYIAKVSNLPPAPKVIPELMRLLNQPDVESGKIVKLISYDPSLTANVLRVCNSAYFGAAKATADLQEAVKRLGFMKVYQLVIAATGSKMLSPSQLGYGMEHGDLWKHSVAAAVASQQIALKLGEDASLAFTATLLHDIGKIVLSQSLDGTYTKLIKETENNQLSLLESEKKLLGVNHAEVGGQLLSRWKFPPSVVSAVWYHHSPKLAGPYQKLASLVYLGNMVSYFMGYGYGHVAFALKGRAEVLETLKVQPQDIPQFMLDTFEQTHIIEALFSMVTE
jgi:putative nucleotidyltransferase with HDIG domain